MKVSKQKSCFLISNVVKSFFLNQLSLENIQSEPNPPQNINCAFESIMANNNKNVETNRNKIIERAN